MHRMGSGGNNKDAEFQNSHEGMNYSASQMNTSSYRPSGGAEPFFGSGWDPNPMVSLSENFGGSSMVSQGEFRNSQYPGMMESQGIGAVPHFPPQYPLECYGSGNFSEMVGSFVMPQSSQIVDSRFPPNYVPNQQEEGGNSRNGAQSLEECQVSEERGVSGASLVDGKRRKRVAESNSPLKSSKNAGEEPSGDSSDAPKEQDDKKMKVDQTTTANSRGKQVAKQAKDDSQSGDAAKDNYIHVRARRGQATNSHSLAERVRREKISERMRLLQELVPGCNKITGKAVMLDEIINYVQSLQQQVEFLSMKLATVNPELNIDLERLLSKDILHSQGGSAAFLGFNPAVNSSRPFTPGVFPGTMSSIPNPHFPPLPQTALDNELHNVFQMGFDSSSVFDSLGHNANRMKSEL